MRARVQTRYLAAAALLSACGPAAQEAAPPAAPAVAQIERAAPGDSRPPPRDPLTGPNGEKAEIAGVRVRITHPPEPEELVSPEEIHPPAGDRALMGIGPTALLYLDDGTLVIGASDGTVTLRADHGRKRRRFGLRGAVTGLARASEALVAATTDLGVLALFDIHGRLRWERHITAEPLSAPVVAGDRMILAASQRGVFAVSFAGEPLFSHASPLLFKDTCDRWGRACKEYTPALSLTGDRVKAGEGLSFQLGDAHPPVPSLAPTFPLTYHRAVSGMTLATVPGKAGDLWALVLKPEPYDRALDEVVPPFRPRYGSEFTDERWELVHVEGARVSRFPVPHQAAKKEVFLAGTQPAQGPFYIDGLVPGPDGEPWIVARRINWDRSSMESNYVQELVGVGQILELSGNKVVERRSLLPFFQQQGTSARLAASPEGPLRLLCVAAAKPTCAAPSGAGVREIQPPASITALRRVGSTDYLITKEGEILRGDRFDRVPGPEGVKAATIAGTGDDDLWVDGKRRYHVSRFDGARWSEVPLPAEQAGRMVARARDDVFADGGRARWDGQRWSRIFGAPRATSVTALTRDDLWVGAEHLYHATAPGPKPVELAPAAEVSFEGEPKAISLEGPETALVVTRMRFPVSGGEALASARAVSASPDGILWLQTDNRLVEVDGEKATVIRKAGRASFGAWAQPVARGHGYLLSGEDLVHLEASGEAPEDIALREHTMTSLHGDVSSRRGAIWLVAEANPRGVSEYPHELSPHALVRTAEAGFRPVVGLPSAAWTAVAATVEGGAFFAGGLGHGPAGEGILFEARGRLGSAGTRRFRAPASLLAVSAAGPDEAWAVGAAGTILHVRAGSAEGFNLPSGAWLRAVLCVSANDVWLGGDGGTLLHFDGRAFHAVAHGLGSNAAITGLALARGAVWAVSPAGIVRIGRRA